MSFNCKASFVDRGLDGVNKSQKKIKHTAFIGALAKAREATERMNRIAEGEVQAFELMQVRWVAFVNFAAQKLCVGLHQPNAGTEQCGGIR